MLDVDIIEGKNKDTIFDKFPNKIRALQWHSYEVANLEKIKT